ncbi:unnamed protein product [Chrysodeixis includens]|uniref:Epoxide hydrolase n=1 Tax=Chrysodeixis includens TaxID=689277 RepID=A0A9P0FWI0_CHRIL|nr:unnamed protein product [Chrysodeixis includens]
METVLRLLVLSASVLVVQNALVNTTLPVPELDEWWGPEEAKVDNDASIRHFEIEFKKKMIKDLKYRLKNHRPFTPPLQDAAFTYGFNTDVLDEWVSYWADSYNFTAREEHLNQYPHYKTNIQGLDIHFIWIKPEVEEDLEVVPLLMLHGWPGSFIEFYKAIPLITQGYKERGFAVELIVPSLPGFGFSSAAIRPGLGGTEIAVVLRNLMQRLGHDKFYIQGGDWGTYIGNNIASFFPDEVLGYHTNLGISFSPAALATWFMGSLGPNLQALVVEPSLAERLYPITTILKGLALQTGYLHLQSTKPDTVGVGMGDSPSGLLAYILQLMSMATKQGNDYKEDGGLTESYTKDELIDNLMIYWMNNAFTTSARIYAETFNMRNVENGWFGITTPVPTWVIQAKSELIYMSPEMLKYTFTNLLDTTVLDYGGHFLALELPEIFSEDLLNAITKFRSWHEKSICRDEL